MYQFISDIISNFGGRPSGSEQEWKAQEYIRDRFAQDLGNASFESFDVYARGKFDSLKYFCSIHILSLLVGFFFLWAGAILAIVNLVLFLGHFVTYRDWLDPLFKKGKSANVSSTIEPSGPAQQTILFAGHCDSVMEFRWWYRFKEKGLIMTVLAGFMQLFAAVFLLIAALVGTFGPELSGAGVAGFAPNDPGFFGLSWPFQLIWLFYFLLTPMQFILAKPHGKIAVDGAIDNLSGVAVAYGVGRHFAKEGGLKHTRIEVVSFGCEEVGLKGAGAYVKRHEERLKRENAVLINLESFRSSEFLNILPAEYFPLVKYPESLNEQLTESFAANGLKVNDAPLQIGATDAARFAHADIPATCIVGLPTAYLDETYHTRLDSLDQLDQQVLEDVQKTLIHFVKQVDSGEVKLEFDL